MCIRMHMIMMNERCDLNGNYLCIIFMGTNGEAMVLIMLINNASLTQVNTVLSTAVHECEHHHDHHDHEGLTIYHLVNPLEVSSFEIQ